MIRLNVFGKLVGVERRAAGWKPYYLGNEGKRRHGGWAKAQKTHFADGSVFDQIYTKK